jgi:septum formation protein
MSPLILASASPQRKAILEKLGIPFVVMATNIEETTPAGMAAEEVPAFLALKKALAAAEAVTEKGRLVLGADTVVILDGEIFGKPKDEAEARRFLTRFSGRTHKVITALALVKTGGAEWYTKSAETLVTVAELSPADIDYYLSTGEWRGAAGGYRAQGRGALFLKSLHGLESTVVGLPVYTLVELLRNTLSTDFTDLR